MVSDFPKYTSQLRHKIVCGLKTHPINLLKNILTYQHITGIFFSFLHFEEIDLFHKKQ